MSELWQGSVAPVTFDLNLTSPAGGLNLTTVTAGVIKVLLPGSIEASWTAALVGATATTLTLRYTFSGTTDIPRAGNLVAYGALTTPTGVVTTTRAQKLIRAKYEVA